MDLGVLLVLFIAKNKFQEIKTVLQNSDAEVGVPRLEKLKQLQLKLLKMINPKRRLRKLILEAILKK